MISSKISKQEIEQKAIITSTVINKILAQSDLYFGYDSKTKEILFIDRPTYDKGCPVVARMSVGVLNTRITETQKEEKD